MSDYIPLYSLQLSGRSGQDRLQYRDYLQGRSMVEDVTSSVDKVRYSVSESTRELVANIEQLHDRGYEIMASAIDNLSEDVSEGFCDVSWKLDDVCGELTSLNAKFDWGFGRMIAGIGSMNDSLHRLIAIAKTPTETWACEQFEIAREAISRELYPEAVDALLRAINGHGSHAGYPLNHRFHYMLGILYLGELKNTDPKVLDLSKSEASFLSAARCARTDFLKEACLAFTAAGWAAYCQGKLSDAESHCRQAIAIYDQNGETFYQLAKTQMAAGKQIAGLQNLRRAAGLDPEYTLKAAMDPDFLSYKSELEATIIALRDDAKKLAVPSLDNAARKKELLRAWETGKIFGPETKALEDAFAKAHRDYISNTFVGFVAAKSVFDRVGALTEKVVEQHRMHLSHEVETALGHLSDIESGLGLRRQSLNSTAFQNALSRRDQIKTGMQSYEDYTEKKSMLKEAHDLLSRGLAECRTEIENRRSNAEVWGVIAGALVGLLIGIIPVILGCTVVSLVLTAIVWLISAAMGKQSGYSSVSDAIFVLLFICGLLAASIIGAMTFRRKSMAKHEAFVRDLGPEPPLSGLEGRVERPGLLFDSEFVLSGKVSKKEK